MRISQHVTSYFTGTVRYGLFYAPGWLVTGDRILPLYGTYKYELAGLPA